MVEGWWRQAPPQIQMSAHSRVIVSLPVAFCPVMVSTIGDADGEGYYTLVTYRKRAQPPTSKRTPPPPAALRRFHLREMWREISFR